MRWILCVLAVLLCSGQSPSRAFRKARKQFEKGDPVAAYQSALTAFAKDPRDPRYWALLKTLERPLLSIAQPLLPNPLPDDRQPLDEDRLSARDLLPPPDLRPLPDLRDFQIKAQPRELFQQVTKAYGLDCVFDADYPEGGARQEYTLVKADARTALRAAEALTGSFLVVLGEKLVLVAKDTEQKRRELETAVASTVYLPDSLTPQDLQEAIAAARNMFDLTKVGIDTQRRAVVIRDRRSKVEPTRLLFELLLGPRAEVMVDLDIVAVSQNRERRLGATMQSQFPLGAFGDYSPSKADVPKGFTSFLTFGGGKSLLGLGIANAQLIAAATAGQGRNLFHATLRASDGQPAEFAAGDRYPILTAGFFGDVPDGTDPSQVFRPPPTVQFEQLGLTLKLTPRVHGDEELSLEFDFEFKSLAGAGINGIPILANRKLKTVSRMRFDETAVIGGLIGDTLSQSWAVPIFNTTRDLRDENILVLLRPHLVRPPHSALVANSPLWVGSETRLLTPLQ